MKTLSGKHILITRAKAQADRTEQEVAHRGAIPMLFPCLETQCLPDSIRTGLELLEGSGTHVLFTSHNGVRCVAEMLGDEFASAFRQCNLAVVGKKTAAALQKLGLDNVLLPDTASQEGLLASYLKRTLPQRLVFFRAEEGREFLPEALRQRGVEVHIIPAYRTICPQDDASDIRQALQQGQVDAVMLGSTKTTRHYVQRINNRDLANSPALAVISPHVAQCAHKLGLDVQAIAKQASFSSMLDALEHHFQKPA